MLGQALRDHYDRLASEPMPQEMQDLLARLERNETSAGPRQDAPDRTNPDARTTETLAGTMPAKPS
jgi:hypothetical protein